MAKFVDIGHVETEEVLAGLEEEISEQYAIAEAEIQEKLDAYLESYEKKDKIKWQQYKDGEITLQEYNDWRVGQIAMGERWEEMRDTIAEDLTKTSQLAKDFTSDTMPEVYAINYNYGTFTVEQLSGVDTSYTLYNKYSVAQLFDDDYEFYPTAGKTATEAINTGKQLAWDKKQVQSAMIQSLLQGESIDKIAKRVAKVTGEKDKNASVRNARTMTTAVQNSGRLDSYKRAASLGINIKKQWLATLDNRTRHEHRMLDGQVVELGEPFKVAGYELDYPADPNASVSEKLKMQKAANLIQGPAFLIYNCRCTILGVIEGHEMDVTDLSNRNTSKLDEDSYEEWQYAKATATSKSTKSTSNGDKVTKVIETADEATDFTQLKDYVTNNLGMKWDSKLEELDFTSVREGVLGIDYIKSEFPQAASNFTKLTTYTKNDKSIMKTDFNGTIKFNTTKYSTRAAALKAHVDTYGYHPTGSNCYSSGCHESGHVLIKSIISKKAKSTGYMKYDWSEDITAGAVVGEAYSNLYKSSSKYRNTTKEKLIGEISEYAKTDYGETVAEAVADYSLNGTNASSLSIAIWKVLKKELG